MGDTLFALALLTIGFLGGALSTIAVLIWRMPMTPIDNLRLAVSGQTPVITDAVAAIGGGIDQSELQTLADQINTNTGALQAALAAIKPTPPPAP